MLKQSLVRGIQGFILVALLGLSFGSRGIAAGATNVGGKHVFILYPGVDSIWGSYIFVVTNDSQQPEAFTFPVMLPKETVDFQAQDVLSPDELKLGPDGGVIVDKVFPPGETLIQISFKLPATESVGTATFTPLQPFQSLGLFIWQDSFVVKGPEGLEIQKGVNLSDRKFDTYTLSSGAVGKPIVYTFENVPEGRGRLWIIGGIVAAILFVTAFTIAFFTRPRLIHSEEVV